MDSFSNLHIVALTVCVYCIMHEIRVQDVCVCVYKYVSPELLMLSVARAQENSEFSLSISSVSSSCPSSPRPSLSVMDTNGCSSSEEPWDSSNTDPNEPYGNGLLTWFFIYMHTYAQSFHFFNLGTITHFPVWEYKHKILYFPHFLKKC